MGNIRITIAVESTAMTEGVDPTRMRDIFDNAIVELARETGAEIIWRFGDQTQFAVVARSTIDYAVEASAQTAKVLQVHAHQGEIGLPVEPDVLQNADKHALAVMCTLNAMLRSHARQNRN